MFFFTNRSLLLVYQEPRPLPAQPTGVPACLILTSNTCPLIHVTGSLAVCPLDRPLVQTAGGN